MSQSEILELLEKTDEPLSLGEIAKILGVNPKKLPAQIKKMLKYNEIKFKEIDRFLAMEKYNCKRRMRIYYVEE